ncbi:MAG: CDP-alcohol phosphatidyltransferase family protein [Rhodothermales bacterium]|nr:CDP-alcohol phosphatidyltransferase family protein [Rhodothermales bacterium]MCA0269255.1 CDP-alcohol phosphatidyltransferase family protein [Bacteroidota bacterium]
MATVSTPPPDDSRPVPPVHRSLGVFWTVPNVLSLARTVLTLPLAWLIWQDGPLRWVALLLVVGIFTDWLDGVIARSMHSVSEWGKVLDPLADKLAIVLVGLALVFRVSEPRLPFWLVGVALLRDVLIVAGGVVLARRARIVPPSLMLGKLYSASFALLALALVLRADPPLRGVLLMSTTVLLALSFVAYLVRFVLGMRYASVVTPSSAGTPPSTDVQEPVASSQ